MTFTQVTGNYSQQDAGYFLTTLFSALHESVPDLREKFDAILVSEIRSKAGNGPTRFPASFPSGIVAVAMSDFVKQSLEEFTKFDNIGGDLNKEETSRAAAEAVQANYGP